MRMTFDLSFGWLDRAFAKVYVITQRNVALIVLASDRIRLAIADEVANAYSSKITIDAAREMIKLYTGYDIEDVIALGGDIAYKMNGTWYVGPIVNRNKAVFLDENGHETDIENATYVATKTLNAYAFARAGIIAYEIKRGAANNEIHGLRFEYINGYSSDWAFKGNPNGKFTPEKVITDYTDYGFAIAALIDGTWYVACQSFDSVYVGLEFESNIGITKVDIDNERIVITDLDYEDLAWI